MPSEILKSGPSDGPNNTLSRRDFLEWCLGVARVAVGTTIANTLSGCGATLLSVNDQPENKERTLIDFLEQRYNIRFIIDSNVDASELPDVFNRLRAALSLYPPDYLNRCCKVQELRITNSLPKRERGKMVALEDRNNISLRPSEAAYALHHEMEHAADNVDGRTRILHESKNLDSIFMPAKQFTSINDLEWAALNPAGTSVYVRHVSFIADRSSQGFVRPEGKINENEDQADVARAMIINPVRTEQMAQDDPILAAKITAWKKIVHRRTHGRMDWGYWEDLKNGKVNEAHWDTGTHLRMVNATLK